MFSPVAPPLLFVDFRTRVWVCVMITPTGVPLSHSFILSHPRVSKPCLPACNCFLCLIESMVGSLVHFSFKNLQPLNSWFSSLCQKNNLQSYLQKGTVWGNDYLVQFHKVPSTVRLSLHSYLGTAIKSLWKLSVLSYCMTPMCLPEFFKIFCSVEFSYEKSLKLLRHLLNKGEFLAYFFKLFLSLRWNFHGLLHFISLWIYGLIILGFFNHFGFLFS